MKLNVIACLIAMLALVSCNSQKQDANKGADAGKTPTTKTADSKTAADKGKIKTMAIGKAAPLPDLKMQDISGKQVSIKDLKKDNGLLVVFSCNTCPFVIDWEDRYPMMDEYCKKNNIGMVVVNPNEAKREGDDSHIKMVVHAKEKGYSFPYVIDKNHQLADACGATRTPELFLFDKDLKLRYNGAIDDSQKDKGKVKDFYIQKAMENMVSGKPIDPSKTKSIGCTIKRIQA